MGLKRIANCKLSESRQSPKGPIDRLGDEISKKNANLTFANFVLKAIYANFATMNNVFDNPAKWSENVIIADADFIDKVAFDLTVNFERMLMRRIPKADLARWIDCVALDGGVREGKNEVQVVLIHDKKTERLDNFTPSDIKTEINGMAFSDHLGEFSMSAYPVEELVSKADFIAEAAMIASSQKEVKRVMVVPDDEEAYAKVHHALRRIDDEGKRITLFAMQPMEGGNYRQEILGYSLMSALGIKGEEIK